MGNKKRAQSINKPPRGERESWEKLKENIKPLSLTGIQLKGQNGETEDEGEIKDIIQDIWKGIIQKDRRKKTQR